jgi:hypothetical protein
MDIKGSENEKCHVNVWDHSWEYNHVTGRGDACIQLYVKLEIMTKILDR